MAADLGRMQKAIEKMVSTSIYKCTQNQKARRGVVNGGTITIGNKVLPFVPAVDMYFNDGDSVWAIIADGGRKAVIVGV